MYVQVLTAKLNSPNVYYSNSRLKISSQVLWEVEGKSSFGGFSETSSYPKLIDTMAIKKIKFNEPLNLVLMGFISNYDSVVVTVQ